MVFLASEEQLVSVVHWTFGSMTRAGWRVVAAMAFETSEEVVEHLPHSIEEVYNKCRFLSALGYPSPSQFGDRHIR